MRLRATSLRLSVDTGKELHVINFGIYMLLSFWLKDLYGLLLTTISKLSYPAMLWHVDVIACIVIEEDPTHIH